MVCNDPLAAWRCTVDPYQTFIFLRSYARWDEDKKRRETWNEAVNRYGWFFANRLPDDISEDRHAEFEGAIEAIRDMQVMPSMRCLWTAGPALAQESIMGYNCAGLIVDSPKAFAEVLYILMCGTGVGFSVERQFISRLPEVPTILDSPLDPIVFEDSKQGWAQGFEDFINLLYYGHSPRYDLTHIRPKGAPLKTFGGRASGPAPLKQLLEFTRNIFAGAKGRKLTSVECHDICCMIANCVVAGGTRRSATISLSNLTDQRMRHVKDGEFWLTHPHRALANNSVAYTELPDERIFMEEWLALMQSGSGERGIVNREGLKKTAIAQGRDGAYDFIVNPCGEVVLRPQQFCNLTEVIVKADDSMDQLKVKIRYATLLGIMQSTLTDFGFIRPEWKHNVEDERLLGVSLTGLCDHYILKDNSQRTKYELIALKKTAMGTAAEWAEAMHINRPKAVTCVKPSGTVSQLVNSSSGLHTRWSKFYVRRVRVSAINPLCQFLVDAGVPHQPEVGQEYKEATTLVFEFPVRSPDESITRHHRTAVEQLEYWLTFKEGWCDHNPSCTIYVGDGEWFAVGAWVYQHFDAIAGLSFLPKDGGNYPLAPYEEIEEAEYLALKASFPVLDYSTLPLYEQNDTTEGGREYACVGNVCEL